MIAIAYAIKQTRSKFSFLIYLIRLRSNLEPLKLKKLQFNLINSENFSHKIKN